MDVRSRGNRSNVGGYDSHANRVADEAGNVVNFQRLHDLSAVHFDRLDADLEPFGNLFGPVAFGDQLQYFSLPRRQPLEGRGWRPDAADVILNDMLGYGRREVSFALG